MSMTGGRVHFLIEGEDAEAAEAFARFFEEEFGVHPVRERAPEREPTRDLDPIAVAALVFSVPQGVLAAIDLAQRKDLAGKLRRLIRRAEEMQRVNRTTVMIVPGQGQMVVLPDADPETVLNLVTDAGRRSPSR